MKPTQWVPALIAAECGIGFLIEVLTGDRGKAIYWLGGLILNIGLAI